MIGIKEDKIALKPLRLEKNTPSANLEAVNSPLPQISKISPSQENGSQNCALLEVKLKNTSN